MNMNTLLEQEKALAKEMERVKRLKATVQEIEAAKARHLNELNDIAKNHGWSGYNALQGALAPQSKARKDRVYLPPSVKAKVVEAYKNRGEKTVAQVAAEFNMSEQALFSIARRHKA